VTPAGNKMIARRLKLLAGVALVLRDEPKTCGGLTIIMQLGITREEGFSKKCQSGNAKRLCSS
jgi:hypothetical protein